MSELYYKFCKITYYVLIVFSFVVVFNSLKKSEIAYADNGGFYAGSATLSNVESSMHPSLSSAEADMVRVIADRDNATNISYNVYYPATWYVASDNYSQAYYNSVLSILNNNQPITGTCSLIAAMNVIYTSREATFLSYYNPSLIGIVSDLYSISVNSYGNNYIEANGNVGTLTSTIPGIVESYFANYNLTLDAENETFSSDVNGATAISVHKMSILSIAPFSEYYDDGTYSVGNESHSVLYNGLYSFKVSYKTHPWYALWGVNHSDEYFNLYRVANGYKNSTIQSFGEVYSLLVFDDNASITNTYIVDLL